MPNIRCANMCAGRRSYKQIDNFREFYYEDRTNTAYYSDWDRILRYRRRLDTRASSSLQGSRRPVAIVRLTVGIQ
jgi:hypothetical protein